MQHNAFAAILLYKTESAPTDNLDTSFQLRSSSTRKKLRKQKRDCRSASKSSHHLIKTVITLSTSFSSSQKSSGKLASHAFTAGDAGTIKSAVIIPNN